MSWKYVDDLLLKLSKNSTVFGKFWIFSILLFRLLVLTAFGDHIWSDEQREFTCNTRQPGCENVCFNIFTPVSNVRMWGLQMLAVSIPGLFYFLYIMHVMSQSQLIRSNSRRNTSEKSDGNTAESRTEKSLSIDKARAPAVARKRWELLSGHVIPPGLRNSRARCVLRFYLWQIVFRIGIELFFSFLQYTAYFYTWTIPEVFACSRWPCPHTVDCFISRPREKTVFFRYMFAVSGLSVLISLVELLYITCIGCGHKFGAKKDTLSNSSKAEALPHVYVTADTRGKSDFKIKSPKQPPRRKKSLNSFSSNSDETSIASNEKDLNGNDIDRSSNLVSYL